jgi:lysophospholipase L1-like esterase
LAAWHAVYGTDSPWANSWTATTGTWVKENWPGLGSRLLQLNSAASVTFTVTGSSVDLWLYAGGTFTYQIDGGTIVSTGTISGTAQLTLYPISLGTDASHTIKLTATGGTRYIAGLTVYDGSPNGIRMFDAGHTGFTSADFTTLQSTLDYDNNVVYWGYTQPDLVTVCLGANDYLNNNGTDPNAAQFGVNLATVIDSVKALSSNPSVMVIIPQNLTGHEAAGRNWADYRAQMISVAEAKDAYVFDLNAVINPATHLRSDGLHYNDLGHDAITTALIDVLT